MNDAKTAALPLPRAADGPHQKKRGNEFTFAFPFRLSRKPNAIVADISELGFGSVSSHGGRLEVSSIQSTELDASPHEYIRAVFSKTGLELSYTVSEKSNPLQRRIEAAAWLLHVISAANSRGEIHPSLIAFISESLEMASDAVSSGIGGMSLRLSELKEENSSISGKYSRLLAEHELQARSLLGATRKAEDALSRLERLCIPSNDTLDDEVMEWLRAHGGKIDVAQFAQSRSLPPSCIEESLSRLSNGGFIARI